MDAYNKQCTKCSYINNVEKSDDNGNKYKPEMFQIYGVNYVNENLYPWCFLCKDCIDMDNNIYKFDTDKNKYYYLVGQIF